MSNDNDYVVRDKTSYILKSPNNQRSYKSLILGNGIRVLLISDPQEIIVDDKPVASSQTDGSSSTGKETADENGDASEDEEGQEDGEGGDKDSAASLCVDVGSLEDTAELQGIAHLLEHVIFMGNQEYPDENGLDAFLSVRSGSSNATTFFQRTCYEIEIPKKHLKEALRRLAFCFVSPLLTQESIEKEINPVDSEFLEGISNDDSRLEQFMTIFAKEGHGLGNFSWGNRKSLFEIPKRNGIDLRESLLKFWRKYYLSEKMTLVIQSQETFETLEEFAKVFEKIPSGCGRNKDELPSPRVPSLPYDLERFHKIYYIRPIADHNRLIINWSIPSQLKHYRTKPMTHISSLLGHECKGGLLSFLRHKGWATALCAGNDESDADHNIHHAIFSIDITLTELGLQRLGELVRCVFSFMEMIHNAGPQERYYREETQIEQNKIRFEDEMSAVESVTSAAKNMFLYDHDDVLVGPLILTDYNDKVIEDCWKALDLKKANFIVMSKSALEEKNYKQREKWMDIKYHSEPIPDEWLNFSFQEDDMKEVKAYFRLPVPNIFIAKDFALRKEETTDYPVVVAETDRYNLYFKTDRLFKVPKGHINFVLLSSLQKASPHVAAALDLFIEILSINMCEEVYPADMAGLNYSIYMSDVGLVLNAEGFNEVLSRLVDLLIKHVIRFEFDDQTFKTMKERLSQNYYNSFTDTEKLAKSIRYSIFEPVYWTAIAKRNCLNAITKEDVINTHKEFFRILYMSCLIQGNFTKQEAIQIVEGIYEKFNFEAPDKDLLPKLQVHALVPSTSSYCRVKSFCPDEKNSLVTNYYQIGPCDIRAFCRLDLLGNIMYEPAFDVLRTKQGLGYNVNAQYHDTFGIAGYSISVTSPAEKFTCTHVDSRIEDFLNGLAETVANLSEESFRSLVNTRILTKSGPDLHLKEEVERNWSEIISFNYCFDRLKLEVARLKEITLPEFKRFAIEQLRTPNRRKLSVQVVGNGKEAQDECTEISNYNGLSELLFNDLLNQQKVETVLFSLKLLGPKQSQNDKVYVQDIFGFKQPLTVYPVTKVNK